MATKNKGFQPRPVNLRKQATTKIALKKATAENLALVNQAAQQKRAEAESAHREMLNAVTLVLNEHDIQEAELLEITAPTKTEPAYLVVIVKKKVKS